MARPWQPRLVVFKGLIDKQQVRSIAQATGLSVYDAAGRLQTVWLAFQEKADTNGFLAKRPAEWVDNMVAHAGFAEAMTRAGWLACEDNGLRLPGFDEFISKKAIKRIENALRMAGRREAESAGGDDNTPHIPPHTATSGHKVPVVTVQPRLPGTGKQKKVPAKKPAPAREPLFWKFWNAWPKAKRFNQAKAHDEWVKIGVGEELLAKILEAVGWQAASEQWTKDGGTFIPMPVNWLADRRWEDERPPEHRKTTRGPGATDYAKKTLFSILEPGDEQPGQDR